MNKLYVYKLRPYTVETEEGNKVEVIGDIYVGPMPKQGEEVCCAWFTDGQHEGSVTVTLDDIVKDVERYYPLESETNERVQA